MQQTSLSLLARVQQSPEADSWHDLVQLYTPLIRSWLIHYQVQDADADDLTQEVLTTVSQEIARFDHNHRTGAFRSWLRKILVYRLQNYWRKRRRIPAARGGSSLLNQLELLGDDNSQPSRIWEEQHDQQVVARLIELVRPRFQEKTWEAFRRQMFDGRKPNEVAEELQMPIGSVYVARNRVLTALRKEAEGLVESL